MYILRCCRDHHYLKEKLLVSVSDQIMSSSAASPKPASSLIKEELDFSPPPDSSSPPSPPADTSPADSSPPPEESTPSPSPPTPTPSPPKSPPPSPPVFSFPPPPTLTHPPPSTPPSSPPPSTPSSSPPPPTPPSSPPPATPAQSLFPPPPASSTSTSPPAPNQSPPALTPVTPSTPTPADAAPTLNIPPNTVVIPTPTLPDPPPLSISPPSTFSPNPPSHPSSSIDQTTSDSPPKTSSTSHNRPSVDAGVVVGIVFGGIIIIVLLAVIICLICAKRRRKPQYYMDPAQPPPNSESQYWQSGQQMDPSMHPPGGSFMGSTVGGWGAAPPNSSGEFSSGLQPMSGNMGGIGQLGYEDLAAATNGFSQANLLGQGGFGPVHKGVLNDGRVVAVKSLKSGSGQGEREFQAEVEIISRVHHRHLVSLVGYCIANENKLLVYEFVPNKTLEFHLHGKGQPVMDWPFRLRIAIGTAKGLAYLHEDCLPRIIHRDIKTANILIDNNFEAMVADFGLAKLTTENHTHVSTRVMGTFGYLAPEYASSGKLSEKSDVFSFGVMLLELLTGRQPIDLTGMMMEDSLVDWARPLLSKALEDGNFDQIVDPRLEGKFLLHELAHMAACAAAAIRHSARKRPKMSQIVRALEGDSSLDDLNEGVKPGQSGLYNPNGGTQMYDTRAYNADMVKFKKMVMTSEEFNSSEYGTTSEYGLNPSTSSDGDSREMEGTGIQIKKT